MNKGRYFIGICAVIAAVLLIGGCTAQSGPALAGTLTSASPASQTSTPASVPSVSETQPVIGVPLDTPAWIDAYYNWLKQDSSWYLDPILADLNFDGVPELLLDFWAEGCHYTSALTFINGQAVFIPYYDIDVSQLVGTVAGSDGQPLWFATSAPGTPHSGPWWAGFSALTYDFSDLPDVGKPNELLTISFTSDLGFVSGTGEDGVFGVKVTQNGQELPVTDAQRAMYEKWFYSDADLNTGEDIADLPHLAALEASLNIQPQKILTIDMQDCYGDWGDPTSLNYDKFRQAMLEWETSGQ